MKALLVTYDLQPPWDSGLKVFGRGLSESMRKIEGLDLDTAHSLEEISSRSRTDDYDCVHIVLPGLKPLVKVIQRFKNSTIFKHIVTPAVGVRSSVSTKLCYAMLDSLSSHIVKCSSSDFVMRSYSMEADAIIPPAVDVSIFNLGASSAATSQAIYPVAEGTGEIGILEADRGQILSFLENSAVKAGIDNIRNAADGVLLYSGPLTVDRFPYNHVLRALAQSRASVLIIGRTTNQGAEMESAREIVSYANKLGIQNRVAIALKILNEKEKLAVINHSDVVIQPFTNGSRHQYVAVDPPIFMLEAMACSKPVVTSKAYSFQSIIKNGTNGYALDWSDSKVVGSAIEDCISNKTIGARARQTIVENFSTDIVSRKLKQMYDDNNN